MGSFGEQICITTFRNTLPFGMGFPKKQSAFRTSKNFRDKQRGMNYGKGKK